MFAEGAGKSTCARKGDLEGAGGPTCARKNDLEGAGSPTCARKGDLEGAEKSTCAGTGEVTSELAEISGTHGNHVRPSRQVYVSLNTFD